MLEPCSRAVVTIRTLLRTLLKRHYFTSAHFKGHGLRDALRHQHRQVLFITASRMQYHLHCPATPGSYCSPSLFIEAQPTDPHCSLHILQASLLYVMQYLHFYHISSPYDRALLIPSRQQHSLDISKGRPAQALGPHFTVLAPGKTVEALLLVHPEGLVM